MSHDDVVKAYRTLQRHGLPVPMSDEVGLTFVVEHLCLKRMWVHESAGNVSQTHYGGLEDEVVDMEALRSEVIASVTSTYKQICKEIT